MGFVIFTTVPSHPILSWTRKFWSITDYTDTMPHAMPPPGAFIATTVCEAVVLLLVLIVPIST